MLNTPIRLLHSVVLVMVLGCGGGSLVYERSLDRGFDDTCFSSAELFAGDGSVRRAYRDRRFTLPLLCPAIDPGASESCARVRVSADLVIRSFEKATGKRLDDFGDSDQDSLASDANRVAGDANHVLAALQEPSLSRAAESGARVEAYRFVYLNPMDIGLEVASIRLESEGGRIRLTKKLGWGDMCRFETYAVSVEEWKEFEVVVDDASFWETAPLYDYDIVREGVTWIMEGVTAAGEYHIVDRWAPGGSDGFRRMVVRLLVLAGEIDGKDVYFYCGQGPAPPDHRAGTALGNSPEHKEPSSRVAEDGPDDSTKYDCDEVLKCIEDTDCLDCDLGSYCFDCDYFLYCIRGTCRPIAGEGEACEENDHCEDGLICWRGMCEEIRHEGGPCEMDSHCSTELCVDGACQARTIYW